MFKYSGGVSSTRPAGFGWFKPGSRPVPGRFLAGSWPVLGWFLAGSWLVRGWLWVLCSQLVPAAQGTLSHCRAAAATFPAAQLQRRSAAAFRGNCSKGSGGCRCRYSQPPPPSPSPVAAPEHPSVWPPQLRRPGNTLPRTHQSNRSLKTWKEKLGMGIRKLKIWRKPMIFCEVDRCLVFAALAPIPQHSCWFLQVTLHTPRKPA